MTEQKWMLKGIWWECCRVNGQCPLIFGRDLLDGPCTNLATWKVTEGNIGGVDMEGVIFTVHNGGIGPKRADCADGKKGYAETAIYINDNITSEQKEVLERFLSTNLSALRGGIEARTMLGVKSVRIEIKEENGTFHITSPYYEQHLTLTVGGDGKTPIRIENMSKRNAALSNVRVCSGNWSYKDYGTTMEFHQTSANHADFFYSGTY